MAEVYLTVSEHAHGVNKLQVLKTLRRDLTEAEKPEYLQMFQDEARLAARLNHPNIVQSYDVSFDEPTPFIAMEYLDGQALSRIQERQWSMNLVHSWGVELLPICQVLEALEYAHGLSHYDGTPLNIVHRDVSPQNIFVTYTGHTKLVDFGIAKTLDSKKTRAGVIKGKVAYMSPEQVRGLPVDHRSDLYSVGVILWETVARQCMHGPEPVLDVLNRVVDGRLPALRETAPAAPVELCRIVDRALALEPEQRYPSAAAFREELDAYLGVHGRATERELGKVVTELFAKEREEVNLAVRQALARPAPPATAADPDTLRIPPMLGLLGSWGEAPEGAPRASEPPAKSEQTDTAQPVQLRASTRTTTRVSPRWLFAALPVLAVVGYWLFRPQENQEGPSSLPASVALTRDVPSVVLQGAGARSVDAEGSTSATDSQNTAAVTSPLPLPTARASAPIAPAPTAPPKKLAAKVSPAGQASASSKPAPPPPAKPKDRFDHDFGSAPRKRPANTTLDTSNPWK